MIVDYWIFQLFIDLKWAKILKRRQTPSIFPFAWYALVNYFVILSVYMWIWNNDMSIINYFSWSNYMQQAYYRICISYELFIICVIMIVIIGSNVTLRHIIRSDDICWHIIGSGVTFRHIRGSNVTFWHIIGSSVTFQQNLFGCGSHETVIIEIVMMRIIITKVICKCGL